MRPSEPRRDDTTPTTSLSLHPPYTDSSTYLPISPYLHTDSSTYLPIPLPETFLDPLTRGDQASSPRAFAQLTPSPRRLPPLPLLPPRRRRLARLCALLPGGLHLIHGYASMLVSSRTALGVGSCLVYVRPFGFAAPLPGHAHNACHTGSYAHPWQNPRRFMHGDKSCRPDREGHVLSVFVDFAREGRGSTPGSSLKT